MFPATYQMTTQHLFNLPPFSNPKMGSFPPKTRIMMTIRHRQTSIPRRTPDLPSSSPFGKLDATQHRAASHLPSRASPALP